MRTSLRRTCLGLTTVLLASLAAAGSASAYGPCGVDSTGPTACPITTSPSAVSGSIASGNEHDYFVFYARRHTHFSMTVNDTEDPTCGTGGPTLCSTVSADLLDSQGRHVSNTELSGPYNGVPVPQGLKLTLEAGTYYVVVSGSPQAGVPVPYQVTINPETSPGIQWPPPCIVPKLRHGTSLKRAKQILAHHRCAVGPVTRQRDRRTRRGNVIGLRPRARAVLPYGAKIRVIVSRGS